MEVEAWPVEAGAPRPRRPGGQRLRAARRMARPERPPGSRHPLRWGRRTQKLERPPPGTQSLTRHGQGRRVGRCQRRASRRAGSEGI